MYRKMIRRLSIGSLHASVYFLVTILVTACESSPSTLFVLHSGDKTGIDFSNDIIESDTFNILEYEYIYNGGGVAAADFNNDGLQDLYFTGNMVPNKLYLNQGEFKFKDVTEVANANIPGKWNNGVAVVDINNDGWMDIYVCSTMKEDSVQRANMLFLNKGANPDNIPVFEEVAERYGVADKGHSVMAAFFDYDLDGDLDLYILTNKLAKETSSNYRPVLKDGSSPTTDRLYRNNGNGTFTNVSKEAGILYEGYGLGLAIADFNADGWPDIYTSNDFLTNDLLYINNQDGTFTNQSPQYFSHQSMFSMGNDAVDFNNDGLTDLVTVDMLPETNQRRKTMINNKSYSTYIYNERYQYEYQYMRNMLQVNNGPGAGFSEVGQMSGIYQTEWSWSALFADFDNDGLKDLAITNGFPKDITDKDFMSYRSDVGAYISNRRLIDSIPVVKIPNFVFKNSGDLTFKDVSKEWGFTQPSFSNGAAFTDLDNDGDLDYVVNNINDKAFVYENTLNKKDNPNNNHYIRFKLSGPSLNKEAIGAKVSIYYDGKMQYAEHKVVRGYLSSVEAAVHFGLGKYAQIDSAQIVWPDGANQTLVNPEVDKVINVNYDSDGIKKLKNSKSQEVRMFQEVSDKVNLIFKHQEEDKIDFNIQRTLPHKFSQYGPGISVGDFTGDGLEDVIIGGSFGNMFTAFAQTENGSFVKFNEAAVNSSKNYEDEGLLLFDADGDGDLDLYAVSGSIESPPDSKDYQDRLYKNMGKGKFVLDTLSLPETRSSGSCVRAADIDGDNDLDLFVAGRVVPAGYPTPARSYLLRNDNGVFTDVTESTAPDLKEPGMVTDALFTDFDNDGKVDLILTGEFMPVTTYRNDSGKFIKLTSTGLEEYSGWWNSIMGGDFDKDGDIDYVAGNLGRNNDYNVTKEFPLHVFAKDFDNNGSVDPVLACYIKVSLENNHERKLFPIHYWDELNSQSPRFRQQFSRYKQYANATIHDIFSEQELTDALHLQANYFETSYIENTGNGKFTIKPMPSAVQTAPVNGMVTNDVNSDGNLDVLLVGNDYGNEVFMGRYDAFTGLLLLGDGKGNFQIVPSSKSGFLVDGDAKGLVRLLASGGEELFLATQNRDVLKVFSKISSRAPVRSVFSPEPEECSAEFIYSDGTKMKTEFYYGSGYLSQSSRKLTIPDDVKEVIVYNFKGQSRRISKDKLQ